MGQYGHTVLGLGWTIAKRLVFLKQKCILRHAPGTINGLDVGNYGPTLGGFLI